MVAEAFSGGGGARVVTPKQPDLDALTQKLQEENEKRIRSDGNAQYIDLGLATSGQLQNLADDPWADHEALNKLPSNLKDGDEVKVLILGAGFGGLIWGAHLIDAGIKPEEMRLVDTAGGFGGTWYWNRYPGLMCDVESSVYLPLLDRTGYMPKHRFSYGPELKAYANLLAEKFNLVDQAVFRTTISAYDWEDESHRWRVTMKQYRGPNEAPIHMTVTAQFVVIANGILNHPKAPDLPGFADFKGRMTHTARWDYGVTGGASDNWDLSGLEGKKVAIIGTGATAVQVVPHLAKCAGELYVFQRTPSAIDERGQRATDPEEWQKITSKPGWWKARNENWISLITGYPTEGNDVKDGWAEIPGYKYLSGGYHERPYNPEDIPGHIEKALADDAPRSERLRKFVEKVVTKDRSTAEALQAWYPAWCKRPCFHDDYLPSFNRENVTLVHSPKGVERLSPKGIVVGGKEYEVDVIVWGTGYRAPSTDMGEPTRMSNMTVTGRDGTLRDKWMSNGPATLHALLTNGFPNLFLSGPAQMGTSPNYVHALDQLGYHTAYIIKEALRRAKDPSKATVEATREAEEAWSMEIQMRSGWMAPMSVCGPNYFNDEGAVLSEEEKMKAMRGTTYPLGVLAFQKVLQKWREEGNLEGAILSS